jgi:hypothetical protein
MVAPPVRRGSIEIDWDTRPNTVYMSQSAALTRIVVGRVGIEMVAGVAVAVCLPAARLFRAAINDASFFWHKSTKLAIG